MDLRPYAERLAKAMPERFEFVRSNILKPHWHLEDQVRTGGKYPRYVITDSCGEDAWWAFFGPLLDEFCVRTLNPHCYRDQYDEHSGPGFYKFSTLLEAAAESVCRTAEAKAKEVGK